MWTPSTDRDEIAARLRRLIPEVMRRWEGLARAAVPAAQRADRPWLHDRFPLFLEDLAQAIALGKAEVCRGEVAFAHAEQRAEADQYSLGEVVREYHLLRQAVVEVMSEECPLEPAILKVVHGGVDAAVEDAADHFARFQHGREERFHFLVENVQDFAIFELDQEGRVTYWNAAAERIYGYSTTEILGQPMSNFYLPEDVEQGKYERELERAAHEGRCEVEGWRVRKDGSRFFVNSVLNAVYDGDGNVRGFVRFTRDITERKKEENARRQLEARHAATLHAALDAIVQMDHEGRVVEWNPSAENLFGYARQDALGQELAELIIPPELREQHRNGLAQYLETGVGPIFGQRLELPAVRADGRVFLVELAVVPIPVDGLPMFTGYLRDISERKRLEEQLQERAEELERADREKNRFLAVLAHELRTPLSVIASSVYFLEQMHLEDRALRPLATINRQSRNMTRLIEDLLDLSRITSGKLELRCETFSVCWVASGAAESMRPSFESRGLELHCSLTPENLVIEADPIRLEQVITNLLNNAAKYTTSGGSVWLTVEREDDQATIRVRDTGAGIPADMLPRLFDLFSQVEGHQERSEGGLGIGLNLVKRLVEMLGGSVTAYSEGEGKGAEFVVRLPLEGESS